MQRFGDVDQGCPEVRRDLVMHAALKFGKTLLPLSDGPGEAPVPTSGAVQVALALGRRSAATQGLRGAGKVGHDVRSADGRTVGDVFAALADQFGVGWMLTASSTLNTVVAAGDPAAAIISGHVTPGAG